MNHQESNYRPHSREDRTPAAHAAFSPDDEESLKKKQQWHPLEHQETDRDKDHTYTGKTDADADNESSENRDPDHALDFRGEEPPHPEAGKHKHSSGGSDPGFGAFDRG
jgi:hypothetical protein